MQSDEDSGHIEARGPNVFIFGAGVSASLGIPVTRDILRMTMLELETADPAKAREVHALLKYFYPYFSTSDRNYPNIEDFLNLLEMARLFNNSKFVGSSKWKESRLNSVQQIVLRALANYVFGRQNINRKDSNHSTSRVLEVFAKHVITERSIVITFNWDLTFEAAFNKVWPQKRLRNFYDHRKSSKATTLLKPHGSINWFTKDDLKQFRGLQPRKLFGDVFVLDDIDFILAQDLITATPLIVPPIFNKNFSGQPVFEKTWISTYWAIRKASNLTILGYSLPKEDQFARIVIRRALRNNIDARSSTDVDPLKVTVVNPDPTVEQSFAQIVGRDQAEFKFRGAYFEDYVGAVAISN
jgi:hypothetical protein